jgi:hypothetical protein
MLTAAATGEISMKKQTKAASLTMLADGLHKRIVEGLKGATLGREMKMARTITTTASLCSHRL